MTEQDHNPNDENDELRSLGVPESSRSFAAESPVEFTCRYLHKGDPARLLLHGVAALIIVELLTALQMYGETEGVMKWAIGALIFVFGVIGSVLSVWAVGRLISDAIESGANHE